MGSGALGRVLAALRCPVCRSALALDGRQARCTSGHAFDVAKQGYLSLLAGRGVTTGDTTAMVAARDDALGRGVLDPVRDAVADAAGTPRDGLVLDLAGGTGYYLAGVLDRSPDAAGICLDAAAPALRRAARAHPRAAAVGADAWAPLPLTDASVAVALSVFGPRNAGELRRVLTPAGRLVVASPAPDHLDELVRALGLVSVDPRKAERQATTFADFRRQTSRSVRYDLALEHDVVRAVVTMGPSAAHLGPDELAERLARLPSPVPTTIAVEVTTYGLVA